jgi:hypothetical protein
MIWSGRPGMWEDWQRFQAEARKERQAALLERQRKRQQMLEIVVLATAIILGLGLLVGVYFFLKSLR